MVVWEAEDVWASTPLPWYPGDAPLPDDAAAFDFMDAEALEFRGDLAGATAAYQALARASNREVRAGALARLARVERKRGQPAAALAAYDALASMTDVTALGRPADLLARVERLALLEELGDVARVVRGSSRPRRGPARGPVAPRPQPVRLLSPARDDDGPLGERPLPTGAAAPLAIAEAVSSTAEAIAAASPTEGRAGSPLRLRSGQASPASTRRAWSNAHGRGFVVWRRVGDRVAALVATEAWLARTWLADVRGIAQGQRARVSLTTSDGTEWLDASLAGPTLRRSAGDTGLPFTVRVASADPTGDSSTFAGRRRLLAGIVGALALLMIGAGYVAARGLAREVAAARLQSDFVAAVSHEFRTPVASVRQLIELLDEGRVADETKRARVLRPHPARGRAAAAPRREPAGLRPDGGRRRRVPDGDARPCGPRARRDRGSSRATGAAPGDASMW